MKKAIVSIFISTLVLPAAALGVRPRADANSGYLYFPKPPRKAKNTAWELRYENSDGRIRLPLSK